MYRGITLSILAAAFVLASISESTAIKRKSAGRDKLSSPAAATSPAKPAKKNAADDSLDKLMQICRCSDILGR